MNLSIDIIKILLDYLPIIDKRNLIKSCKYLKQLYPLMKIFETEFIELLNTNKFVSDNPIKFTQYERYVLEYIYYDRENIPIEYLKYNKNLLVAHRLLYFNMADKAPNICKKIYSQFKANIEEIMDGAVVTGNLKMVKWARMNGSNWGYHTYDMAARYGQIKVLKLLYKNNCSINTTVIYNSAASNGQLEVLKWAHKKGWPLIDNICSIPALNGHLEVIKWAHENGCEWSTAICSNAALKGNLEILKWVRVNGCPWDSGTCSNAALNGHLDVLKWARENGCPWNESTCSNAVKGGHLEVLKWARENGCEWDDYVCLNAIRNSQFEILEWALKNGCEWNIMEELENLDSIKKKLENEIDILNTRVKKINNKENQLKTILNSATALPHLAP